MTNGRLHAMGATGIVVAAIMTMSACATGSVDTAPGSSVPESVATGTTASPDPQEEQARPGAVESYLAWLEASRVPDVDAACARLTPELVTRMLAELNETGPLHAESCEEMITVTAELYRAAGQGAEVDIVVQQETETDATLFVTSLASGDCGTIVMTRTGADWLITEQSEECAVETGTTS